MPMVELKDGQVNKVGLWHGTVIKMGPGREAGRRFKVTKINPVNVKIMDETGRDGYTLNREYAERHIDPDQSWDGPAEKTPYVKYLELHEAGITLGSVVKLTDSRLKSKYGSGKYAVIAMPNDGTLKLAKLGGDGGRYLHKLEASQVEIVPVD